MGPTLCPEFDVLREQTAWDAATRAVILDRLKTAPVPSTLSEHEAETLRALVAWLLEERRDEMLAFVVATIDKRLHSPIGEAQRKPEALPQQAFFKKTLALAVEALASHPLIWSEMGYAGPAYPRGYYRIRKGLRDPWESKPAKRGSDANGASGR